MTRERRNWKENDPVQYFHEHYSHIKNRAQLEKEDPGLCRQLRINDKLDEVLQKKQKHIDYSKTDPVNYFRQNCSDIKSRKQLAIEYQGLYKKLLSEGRLDEVLPETQHRDWTKQDPVELFRQQYSHIRTRSQLKKEDSGLYKKLLSESRLGEVLPETQHRDWTKQDPVELFRQQYSHVISRSQLKNEDAGLYSKLLKDEKLDEVLLETQHRDWTKQNPVELFRQQYFYIKTRGQLDNEDRGLYHKLLKDGKLDELLPEKQYRDYCKIDSVEFFKQQYSYITSRYQLRKEDFGLYQKLWKENRLGEVLPNKESQRKQALEKVIEVM